MKKRQDAEQPLIFVERDYLATLLDIGEQVKLREHDAFRFAGAAAGKNNRSEVVHAGASGAKNLFQ